LVEYLMKSAENVLHGMSACNGRIVKKKRRDNDSCLLYSIIHMKDLLLIREL